MRDIVFVSIVLLSVPISVVRPFYGVLVWTWIAFMVPQRLCWGFAVFFPAAMPIAAATLLGFAFSSERKPIPRTLGTFLLIVLYLMMSLSTMNAYNWEDATAAWEARSKILLMMFVMMALVRDRARFDWVVLVTALSLGFLGVKGGVFTIVTGGQYPVLGPLVSSLGGNNHLAVGLNMILPLLLLFSREMKRPALVWGFRAAFALCAVAVVGTYSRGGMLGLATVLLALAVKGRRRLMLMIVVAIGFAGAQALAPARWTTRMETISAYEQDSSAMSRINAWHLAWRLAQMRPLLGWGPEAMEDKGLYDLYYPDSTTQNDVHSAYFQLLSEGGFTTFGVWLAAIAWTMLTLQVLGARYRGDPESGWIGAYADAFQISMLGYLVSAAFLEMGWFDLLFHLIGLTIVLTDMVPTTAPVAVRAKPRLSPLQARLAAIAADSMKATPGRS